MIETPNDPPWHRLGDFRLDQPDARLGYSDRLARENAWSPDFTRRVIEEYKRFCYLALKSGHPVTPSDQVDQAWHLHLVHTDSYWQRLCGEVLEAPLHRGPTRGGAREQAKFHDWYSATLASYRRHLGAPPPPDIWPAPSARFRDTGALRRVNRARNWVLPIPAWGAGLKRCLLPGLAASLSLGPARVQAEPGSTAHFHLAVTKATSGCHGRSVAYRDWCPPAQAAAQLAWVCRDPIDDQLSLPTLTPPAPAGGVFLSPDSRARMASGTTCV